MPFVKLGIKSEKTKQNTLSAGDGVGRVAHQRPPGGGVVGAIFPMADLIKKAKASIPPFTSKEIMKHNVGKGSTVNCSLQ